MKTMFKSFALVAIAALTLAACSKTEAPINEENDLITLKFNIKNADEASTRALLGTDSDGNRFLNWENGDQIGSFAEGTFGSNSTSNNNAGNVVVNGDDFTLNIQTFNSGTVTKIYSYFPFSSAAGKDKASAIVSIPATQYITTDGFDADAMPMAGTPVTVNLATEANTDKPCGTINFSNLGSIINFKIYSSEDTDETLTSVKYVTTSGKLGGSYTIDLTAIDAANESTLALGGTGSDSEITTIHQGKPAIGTGKNNAIDVYMVVAPGSYTGTQVVVTTSAKTYTLTASGEKTYVRSHVKPMYVDIKKGTEGELPQEETWVKVTSVSDFTAGTYYILNWDEKKYLPNDEAGSAPAAKDFMGTVTDDMKWEASVSNGGLVFKNPDSELYLWGQDGTNNGVRVKKTAPADASNNVWKFTANSSFGVIASVGTTRYLATYNNSGTQQDWRNYQIASIGDGTNTNASGQVTAGVNNFPAVFYKLQDGSIHQKETPELAFSNPTTTVNVGEYVTNVATINPSSLSISYSSDPQSVATVDATGKVKGIAAGTATITASFDGDDDYNAVSASYVITVVDPNANDGSEAKPYTASEAASAATSTPKDDIYVKGIISAITTAYNNGVVSFDISDDGLTGSTQFRIYKASATSADDFKVGDAVIFVGTLKLYNTTPELDGSSTSTALTLKYQLHAPTFTPDGGSFTTDNLSVQISAVSGATIRYTLDETTPTATTGTVYESAITISESMVIKAIAVKDGMVTGVVTKTFTKSAGGQEVTLAYTGTTTGNFGTGNEAATVGLSASEWSVIATQGEASNNVGYNKAGDIRLYYNAAGSNTLTVSSLNNATINFITITYTGDSYSNGKVLVDGSEVSKVNGAYPINSTSFAITNGNTSNVQVRISSIVINYTPSN